MNARFEIPVTIRVQWVAQFGVFYVLFPCVFIACVAFYDWAWWLALGVMAVLSLGVMFKAWMWLRFWRQVEALHLDVDGDWYLFRDCQRDKIELLSMSRIPGVAFIFYFQISGVRYTYIVFSFQLEADAQRMLTIYLKFLS